MAFFGSTTNLGDTDEWSSGPQLTDGADKVVGIVFADVDGTIHIEQSADGVNWDVDNEVAVTGDTGITFSQELFAPYVQIRFVNGASDQAEFRLSAHYSSAGRKG